MHDDSFMQIGFSLTHIKGAAWSFFNGKEKIRSLLAFDPDWRDLLGTILNNFQRNSIYFYFPISNLVDSSID
jgi:lipoprotein signal peptidase